MIRSCKTHHFGFRSTRITESPRINILLRNRSLLMVLAFLHPFPVFGTSVHSSFTFSRTMLQCLSKAFTRPRSFRLFRQLISTCALVFTLWLNTDKGPAWKSWPSFFCTGEEKIVRCPANSQLSFKELLQKRVNQLTEMQSISSGGCNHASWRCLPALTSCWKMMKPTDDRVTFPRSLWCLPYYLARLKRFQRAFQHGYIGTNGAID